MIVMIVMIITMMMMLILTKVSGPDPEGLEVTELLHAGAGRGAGTLVRHLQAQLAALEAATCRPADYSCYSCYSCYSAGMVTLSPGESARELPQLAPVRVGVAVRAADRAAAALLGPALAAADRQLQLLQAVVHRVQLLSALPGSRP